ncbi:MAG TPA: hypothetical protein VNQ80_09095 [Parapedobacter sp.]|uniref:hypothetical protein n=1 Tax=Parapedobacter sp. TaxID=1958893 RepID=UPI002B5FC5AE|nr:hypothetical protein [Parapedobacter sp.]HWK57481.1 hypothetical protein [Parapedobacter sp.]
MKKKLGTLLLLTSVLLMGFAQPARQGDTLYNGIILPEQWPPKDRNPRSAVPMDVPYLTNPPAVINIDVGRQLFVDDFLIDKTDLVRTYHQAKKHPLNPVFKAETVHEKVPEGSPEPGYHDVTYLGHGGVFYDYGDRIFKMFYTAGWRGGLAMATSTDLLNWDRPDLGMVDQNIILPPGWLYAGGDNAVWIDNQAVNPNEKYKALIERGGHLKDGTSHTLHVSRDGRIWSQGRLAQSAGDYCSFFHNPFRDKWVYSIKKGGLGRARWYHESDRFLEGRDWDNAVFWLNADSLDEPDPGVGDPAQLYSLNAVAYESLMIGEFYIHLGPDNRIAHQGKFPKITELKVGFSRDGFHWHRPDRRPFINATRKEGDWDRAYLHGTMGVFLVKGDELWFPYCGYSGIASDGSRGIYTGASIGMATLRRDGFASMDAGRKKGSLLTRPLVFNGNHLFVNVDCPDGELRIAVLDEHGRVLKGFSEKECTPIQINKTLYKVSWDSGEDLSAFNGKPIKFRFQLTNGKLYSFWVSPDQSGASYGYVGAGGPGYGGVLDDKGIHAY